MQRLIWVFCLLFIGMGALHAQKTITFPSKDSLTITADWYEVKDSKKPVLLLCHQAMWSRGEYIETAKKLNALGFSCLAIDQRSGRTVNDIDNATYQAALAAERGTLFLDARIDIEAAIDYVVKELDAKCIVVGSSYSASLALWIANENKNVHAVAAFSPGDYFKNIGLEGKIAGLKRPVYIACEANMYGTVIHFYNQLQPKRTTFFRPPTSEHHGSRMLWSTKSGHEAHWAAFGEWLEQF